VASLAQELDELTFGGKTEEEVAHLKKTKHEMDKKLKEQVSVGLFALVQDLARNNSTGCNYIKITEVVNSRSLMKITFLKRIINYYHIVF